jgi:ribosomal protein S21
MQVFVRDNYINAALRVLKKKMQREGTFREMKLRRSYEKPSERRKPCAVTGKCCVSEWSVRDIEVACYLFLKLWRMTDEQGRRTERSSPQGE